MATHVWPEPCRKRGRDGDDDEPMGTLSFTEHRNKRRLQTLPLRTSPTQNGWYGTQPALAFPPPVFDPYHTQAITPVDSDSDEHAAGGGNPFAMAAQHQQVQHQQPPNLFQPQPQSHFSPWSNSPSPNDEQQQALGFGHGQQQAANASHAQQAALDADMDMTGTDDVPMASAEPHPLTVTTTATDESNGNTMHLSPGPFAAAEASSVAAPRMPTPINPSFGSHFGGRSSMGHGGGTLATGYREMQQQDRAVPRTAASAMHDVGMGGGCHSGGAFGWVNRRLPSPISESGNEDLQQASADGAGDAMAHEMTRHDGHQSGHRLDGMWHANLQCSPHDVSMEASEHDGSHLPYATSHSAPTTPAGAPAHDPLMLQHQQHQGQQGQQMDGIDGMSPEQRQQQQQMPKRPGHTRSRHTLNSWTLQPGMKRSFSIGFRADCDKCRQKVPGHFNHIIVS